VLSFQRKTEEEESVRIFGLSGLRGLHKAMNHFVRAPEMLSLLCRGEGSAFACLKSSLASRKKTGFCPKSANHPLEELMSCADTARVSCPKIKVTARPHMVYNITEKQFLK